MMEAVRTLQWCRRAPSDVAESTPPRRYLFEDAEWWFARADPTDPDGLVVAAKGGHNDEPHNHNDCGSLVVHYHGESPVTDPGSDSYDRDYFGDRRYEYLATRSIGHSVPYVNGREQATGREYAAKVVETVADEDADRFSVELAGCYPSSARVSSLRRTIELDRPTTTVTITDETTFDAGAEDPTFESVLVSHFPIEATGKGLTIEGRRGRTRVAFEPAPRIDVERLPEAIGMSTVDGGETRARDVWRARVSPPVETGGCELEATLEPTTLE